MTKAQRQPPHLHLLVLALVTLAGCGLLKGTPTPIPWVPTATPPATAQSQTAATATPTEYSDPPVAPSRTATVAPTATASAPPTALPASQVIILDAPTEGATVSNPVRIRGKTKVMPFEGTLVVKAYDAEGQLAAQKPIIAVGEIGSPATFETEIMIGGRPGSGRIEVLEISPKDGDVQASATANVTLTGFPGGGYIEVPAPMADVTLPIPLLARVGTPGQDVEVTVRWDDGTQFSHTFPLLAGLDNRGLLVVPLDFVPSALTHPATQAGTIEIQSTTGSPLAWQPVHILAPDDPGTMATKLFWIVDDTITPQEIRIPRTMAIGRASLNALLWGPVPQNIEGYSTLIPSAETILTYPGRGPDWGERIRVRNLRIEDGVAYADFTLELGAHAGGALVVTRIREQIEATLTQFSTVDDVVISINGMTGVLEP